MLQSRLLLFALIVVTIAACANQARLPISAGTGPQPELPAPNKSMIPTVHIAPAKGWHGAKPDAMQGTSVNAFADGLSHPRWLYTLPNGDVLVAETDAPPKPDDSKGIKGKIYKSVQRRAGSGKAPSANRITLLRDTDGDGAADVRTVFIGNLNSPFGMALVGDNFYVADSDAVLRFPYQEGQTHIDAQGVKLTDLPAGTLNHHWTKSLIASRDGRKLYVGVGSNSNVAENGIAAERDRAAIWEIDTATGEHRVFAWGLRNPVGLAWEPESGALWVAVNERDELGSDLVPDYMTAVHDGAFYGWPYSYYGQHIDDRVQPPRPDLTAKAVKPDYALGPHTASLGLCAAEPNNEANNLPQALQRGMFVGQHGSWNRKPFSGYKVIFVPFENGKPSGPPKDVLTGFVNDKGEARGRPVGVAIDRRGDLLVADDVGNTVWRVTGETERSNVAASD